MLALCYTNIDIHCSKTIGIVQFIRSQYSVIKSSVSLFNRARNKIFRDTNEHSTRISVGS